MPPNAVARMQNALRNFVTGKIVRDSPLKTADLTIRKVAALEALDGAERLRTRLLLRDGRQRLVGFRVRVEVAAHGRGHRADGPGELAGCTGVGGRGC